MVGECSRIRRTFGKKTRKFDEQTFENDFRFPPQIHIMM